MCATFMPSPAPAKKKFYAWRQVLKRRASIHWRPPLLKAARERHLIFGLVTDFKATPGKGIQGKVDGRDVALGNELFFKEMNLDWGLIRASQTAGTAEVLSVIGVAINRELLGWISVSDPIKPSAKKVLSTLREQGLRVIMATGGPSSRTRIKSPKRSALKKSTRKLCRPEKAELVKKRCKRKGAWWPWREMG